MADAESKKFRSKRIRLSTEREIEGLSPPKAPKSDKEGAIVDEEPILSNFSVFQETSCSSREHDGGNNEFSKHEQFDGDDFPSCFSVEDDIDNIEERHYQPIAGPMGWVQRQMTLGINPREILSYMIPHAKVPTEIEDSHSTLWKIIIGLLTSPTPRQKLDYVNTLDDVVSLVNSCKNIVVLTGAGVSVSCGIPDFRSRDGIYARLSQEYPDLPDPQAMFDITYFNQNPKPFFKFAKEIYPGQFKPSLSHRFIRQIEERGHLLRNYSQNIDTLEQIAGITRVIQCHGSFSTASCTNCKYQVSSSAIKEDIFSQKIPTCPKCKEEEDGAFAIMKPDIVFFGENLPSDFYHHLEEDSEKADLLIVIGSSLKVRPVALIPSRIAEDIPQILINREPLRHMTFDVELLGDCDVIVTELCKKLGGEWTSILDETEVPTVDRDLYTTLAENTSNDQRLLNSDREESTSLELHKQNPLQDQTSCGPLSVPMLDHLSQTPTHTPNLPHKLQQEDTLLHREDTTIPGVLTVSDTLPQAQLQIGPDQDRALATSHLFTDSLETERESFQSLADGQSVMDQASPEIGPKTSPFRAAMSMQEPKLPLSSCQSVGEDTCGMASSFSDITDKQRVDSSVLGDLLTVCQYPSNQHPVSTDKDCKTFLYFPPNRYIFYGAELCNSPLHSPFDSPTHDEDVESENYNSDHDSRELSLLEANGYSSEDASGDGSEGYGSGAMSATDLSNYDLKLITGALGDYSCVSEENSVMSGVELFSDENRDGRLDSLAYVLPSENAEHQTDISSIGPSVDSSKDNITNIVGLNASNLSTSQFDPTTSTESNNHTS